MKAATHFLLHTTTPSKAFFSTSTQSNKGRQSLLQLSGMEAGEEGERKRAEKKKKKRKLKHALEINLLKLESQTFILILGFVEELKKALPFSRGI